MLFIIQILYTFTFQVISTVSWLDYKLLHFIVSRIPTTFFKLIGARVAGLIIIPKCSV